MMKLNDMKKMMHAYLGGGVLNPQMDTGVPLRCLEGCGCRCEKNPYPYECKIFKSIPLWVQNLQKRYC